MGDFVMPSLGADMDAGTVLEWRVRPGDTVHRGDIVAVVDTEKSTIEVEVFEDGVVAELLVEPGTEVPVGTPLARITSRAAAPAPRKRAPRRRAKPAAKEAAAPATARPRRRAAGAGERPTRKRAAAAAAEPAAKQVAEPVAEPVTAAPARR
ncbi:MAG TPA: biotin/lipoyl-containing protein, partial [Acidimicrobiales bacterium]